MLRPTPCCPGTPPAAPTCSALRQLRVLAAAAVGVEDERHVRVLGAHGGDDALGVGQRELSKLLGAQVVRPGVEQLDDLRGGGAERGPMQH